MMQPISSFVVNILPILKFIQFPWRLLLIEVFSIAVLSVFVFEELFNQKLVKDKKILVILTVFGLLLFFNRNHWKVNEYYPPPAYFFDDRAIDTTTTLAHEHAPRWQNTNVWQSNLRFEVKQGKGVVLNTIWKTNYHEFMSSSSGRLLLTDRTVYYPGWQVFVDGVKTPTLDPWNPLTEGLVTFEVPKGAHTVRIILREPLLHKIVNTISLVFLVLSLSVFFKRARIK